jgi:serine/threonine-protein kinase
LLEERIGRGGMGIVVAAKNLALGERVALKFVSAESSAAIQRLLREARLAAAIKSDHIAKVLDVGTTDAGAPYLVMEHLEGESLAQRLHRPPTLGVDEVLSLTREICRGLAAAHAKGIVHRDLKPSNIFLARRSDGAHMVKVVDFGVAKELVPNAAGGDAEGTLTTSTTVLGSPVYMAPEQVRSAANVDARADVWSLGATVYEMLAGRPPFVAETTPGVLAAVVADRPRPLREARPEIPKWLEAVVLRCLEKSPEARYANVASVASALDSIAPASHAPASLSVADRGRRGIARRASATVIALTVALAIGRVLTARGGGATASPSPKPAEASPTTPAAVVEVVAPRTEAAVPPASVLTAVAVDSAARVAPPARTSTRSARIEVSPPPARLPREAPSAPIVPASAAASSPTVATATGAANAMPAIPASTIARPDVSAATADRH